jgi:hypothetical protein
MMTRTREVAMATKRRGEDEGYDHERAAAGQDYDNPIRERAASIGARLAEDGPGAVFDEIENLLPEEWQDHIRTFPVMAVLLGVGVGVWLGMTKSKEIIAAGGALISAAAVANVGKALRRDEEE